MTKNWKTSLAGLGAILTALADVAHSLSTGAPINWSADLPAIVGGVGLLLAKDGSTHSTEAEVETSTAKTIATANSATK
jgi:hypothetical protein